MSCAEIHIGDIGTQFKITVVDESGAVVDISSATSLILIFKNPNGLEISKTGTLLTDGTDGRFYYTSESGFLAYSGLWSIQAHVIYGSSQWYSSIDKFTVKPNL